MHIAALHGQLATAKMFLENGLTLDTYDSVS